MTLIILQNYLSRSISSLLLSHLLAVFEIWNHPGSYNQVYLIFFHKTFWCVLFSSASYIRKRFIIAKIDWRLFCCWFHEKRQRSCWDEPLEADHKVRAVDLETVVDRLKTTDVDRDVGDGSWSFYFEKVSTIMSLLSIKTLAFFDTGILMWIFP